MTCLRCHRDVGTLDGHCTPCRRHLGMEPLKMPRTRPARQKPSRYVHTASNPTRAEVKAAYEASLATQEVIEGTREPSLPEVAWLKRPMPRGWE